MTTPITLPTAGYWLFGDDIASGISTGLASSPRAGQAISDGLKAAGMSSGRAAQREIAKLAGGFLDLDLAEVAIAGWRKHRELVDAARATQGTASTALVAIAERDTVLTQRPQIDLVIGQKQVAPALRFELRVTIRTVGVGAVVRDGKLVAFDGGACTITVSFRVADVLLGERTAEMSPWFAVPLGGGIPLLADEPPTRAALPAGPAALPADDGQSQEPGRQLPKEPPALPARPALNGVRAVPLPPIQGRPAAGWS